jgi:nitrate/nitrite transport system substrate-binding protein
LASSFETSAESNDVPARDCIKAFGKAATGQRIRFSARGGFFRFRISDGEITMTGKKLPFDDAALPDVGRRGVLKLGGAAATASLFGAINAAFPGGAFAAGPGPEVKGAKLGFIALTDAAPLIVAKEKGLFARYGMPDVVVAKQASWGATRDNLVLGSGGGGIDGAHILSPMPYLLSLGKIGPATAMSILARLNVNGQGISVEKGYLANKVDLNAAKMKDIIAARKTAGREIAMAMTFPGGTHDLWLRYWLAAAGIDPDKDIKLITVPPPQMVANMKADTMEAFCVGEPWNDQLVAQGVGYTAVSTGQLWMNHPEKAFAMRSDWVAAHPNAAIALTAAIQDAQKMCDTPTNNAKLAQIISAPNYLKCPVTDIQDRLAGNFTMGDGRVIRNAPFKMKFWANHASYPYKSHDLWFLTEEQRWGKLPKGNMSGIISKVNRSDIWRKAAVLSGVRPGEMPAGDSRGVERFFDGKTFNPGNPGAYLASLGIKR